MIEVGTAGTDQHDVVFAYFTRDFEPADKSDADLVKIMEPTVHWFAPWPIPEPPMVEPPPVEAGAPPADKPPTEPPAAKMFVPELLRAPKREETEIELWPEEGESKLDFLERCIVDLTPCIGQADAEDVCREKWRQSGKLGKKSADLPMRVALGGKVLTEPCGKSCLACEGAPAPFKAFDPSQPRDEAGKWTDTGGSDGGGGNGGGSAPSVGVKAVHAKKPDFAAAAQKIYDEWDQDAEGIDEELGAGGICDQIAQEMSGMLAGMGIATADGGQPGDEHAWVIANLQEGVYSIDIPPNVYEIGGGYSWTKKPGVTITADDVSIDKIDGPMTDDEFAEKYSEY